jgi:hypothetical protein
LRVVVGTLNWRSQSVQIPIAGTIPTHLSTLKIRLCHGRIFARTVNFIQSAYSFLCTISYNPAMLSAEETAKITAEIERLEKARWECTDGGIRKLIEAWIEEQRKKLASGTGSQTGNR